MARTFIAVTLDPPTRRALASFIATRPLDGAGVRWVRPESLHLTLKFLGDVSVPALENVTRAVVETSRSLAPFEVAVRGAGFFPNPVRPRVFWAGIDRSPELESLAGRIEGAMGRLGFRREKRRFTAHITLARIKGPGREPGGGAAAWRRRGPRGAPTGSSSPADRSDPAGGGPVETGPVGVSGGSGPQAPSVSWGPGYPHFGLVEVSEVVVMESVLGGGGPRYTRLARAPLGTGPD